VQDFRQFRKLFVKSGELLISLLAAGALAWQNRGSKNLVLAASVLGGATFLFITQLYSQLRSETKNEFILTEFGIDRAKPEIRQWAYGGHQARGLRRSEFSFWTELSRTCIMDG
jgi:hypothetical protein